MDNNLAIRPTTWPRYVRGYTEFTERFAIAADVSKALMAEPDFATAATKAWFGAGYLMALTGNADALPETAHRPDAKTLETLDSLLRWLIPIHSTARDNSEVTDTAQLGRTFYSHARAALAGLQFQKHIPIINEAGKMLQPDPPAVRQPLSSDVVIRQATAARDAILPAALWLGARHHL